MIDRCPKSDLFVSMCGHCEGRVTIPAGYVEQVNELDYLSLKEVAASTARFRCVATSATTCDMCGEYVAAGEPVVRLGADVSCERCQP